VLAKRLINCAGLYSDVVAAMAGAKPDVQIVPFRGEYYMVKPDRRHLVRTLIYPVPDPEFPFLGVHFTNTVHGEVEAGPEETEEDFIRQAVEVLEKNIANADFSVDEWSRELGMSRTTLYKRILSATGSTPIGFIRNFRMKRAAQLLEKTRHNVAEVAYMVGFNNPKYFARYFKEVYGKLPSAYQAEWRKKG